MRLEPPHPPLTAPAHVDGLEPRLWSLLSHTFFFLHSLFRIRIIISGLFDLHSTLVRHCIRTLVLGPFAPFHSKIQAQPSLAYPFTLRWRSYPYWTITLHYITLHSHRSVACPQATGLMHIEISQHVVTYCRSMHVYL